MQTHCKYNNLLENTASKNQFLAYNCTFQWYETSETEKGRGGWREREREEAREEERERDRGR